MSRRVRVSKTGRDQILTIPSDFAFDVVEVVVEKEGDRLVIETFRERRPVSLLKTLPPLDVDFPDVDDDRSVG